MRTDWCENPNQAHARVRCTTHDLHFFTGGVRPVWPCFNPALAQPVGIGMLHRFDHPADAKRAQFVGWVFNAFNFQTKIGQRIEDVLEAGGGFKMIFQGARLADVANVLIGGTLVGGAAAFASYIVS